MFLSIYHFRLFRDDAVLACDDPGCLAANPERDLGNVLVVLLVQGDDALVFFQRDIDEGLPGRGPPFFGMLQQDFPSVVIGMPIQGELLAVHLEEKVLEVGHGRVFLGHHDFFGIILFYPLIDGAVVRLHPVVGRCAGGAGHQVRLSAQTVFMVVAQDEGRIPGALQAVEETDVLVHGLAGNMRPVRPRYGGHPELAGLQEVGFLDKFRELIVRASGLRAAAGHQQCDDGQEGYG